MIQRLVSGRLTNRKPPDRVFASMFRSSANRVFGSMFRSSANQVFGSMIRSSAGYGSLDHFSRDLHRLSQGNRNDSLNAGHVKKDPKTRCQDTGVGKRTQVAGLVTHDLPSGLLRTQMQRLRSKVCFIFSPQKRSFTKRNRVLKQQKTRTQEVDPKTQKNSKR